MIRALAGIFRLRHPVSDLGAWWEPTDRLAASYRAQVGE